MKAKTLAFGLLLLGTIQSPSVLAAVPEHWVFDGGDRGLRVVLEGPNTETLKFYECDAFKQELKNCAPYGAPEGYSLERLESLISHLETVPKQWQTTLTMGMSYSQGFICGLTVFPIFKKIAPLVNKHACATAATAYLATALWWKTQQPEWNETRNEESRLLRQVILNGSEEPGSSRDVLIFTLPAGGISSLFNGLNTLFEQLEENRVPLS